MLSRHRLLFLAALLVLLFCAAAGVRGGSDEEDLQRALSKSKEEQIAYYEREVQRLRQRELAGSLRTLMQAQENLARAKRREGFFYTEKKDKEAIRVLDEEYQKALIEVESVKAREKMMLDRIRPLYGPLSTHFVREQRKTISSALTFIKDTAYDSAWYDGFFRMLDRSDDSSFGEIIIGFFLNWLIQYVLLYPFALAYYALWAAPWSVYAYSSGLTSVVPGLVAYLLSVGAMALPIVVLAGGFYLLHKQYPNLWNDLAESGDRRRRRARTHYD